MIEERTDRLGSSLRSRVSHPAAPTVQKQGGFGLEDFVLKEGESGSEVQETKLVEVRVWQAETWASGFLSEQETTHGRLGEWRAVQSWEIARRM